MGIINILSKLQILIFVIPIGNLLINSLYGATETFPSCFEMAFKRCVLEVTFHVNGLDLTYANIWHTSFTDVYIKQWLRRFPREVCMQKCSRTGMRLDDINSFWPGDYAQFMKYH